MGKHLWDWEHPGYCEKSGGESFHSWEAFLADKVLQENPQLNLLFRWDWRQDEADPERELLHLFFVQQRRGYVARVEIRDVKRSQEREIYAWIEGRLKHMAQVVQPFTPRAPWATGYAFCDRCGLQVLESPAYIVAGADEDRAVMVHPRCSPFWEPAQPIPLCGLYDAQETLIGCASFLEVQARLMFGPGSVHP